MQSSPKSPLSCNLDSLPSYFSAPHILLNSLIYLFLYLLSSNVSCPHFCPFSSNNHCAFTFFYTIALYFTHSAFFHSGLCKYEGLIQSEDMNETLILCNICHISTSYLVTIAVIIRWSCRLVKKKSRIKTKQTTNDITYQCCGKRRGPPS